MANSVFKADFPQPSIFVQLETIWKIKGSASYFSAKTSVKSDDTLVAVRTLGGCGTLSLCGAELCASENSLIFFYFRDYMCCRASSEKWNFYWYEFKCRMPHLADLNTVYRVGATPLENTLTEECFNALASPVQHSEKLASCLFSSLVAKWLTYMTQNSDRYTAQIESAVRQILQNPSQNVNISSLAQRVCMSERLFRNEFKKITNQTPKQYAQSHKISTAKQLLTDTHLPIKDIAISLGYTSRYYFDKSFKLAEGASPAQYRRKQQCTFNTPSVSAR